MNINLIALLNDGSPPRAGVLTDARQTVTLPQGSDVSLRVAVVTPTGAPVDLSQPGTELILTCKRKPLYQVAIVKRANLTQGRGIGVFTLEPGDTWGLVPGQYLYDVWLTLDGARSAVIPASMLQLTASVAPVPRVPPPPVLYLVAGDTEPLVLDFSGQDISGWIIVARIGYAMPLERTATLTDPTHGIAEVAWLSTDLLAGRWGAEIVVTKPGPVIQTADEFVMDIRPHV